jgi:hypothetical protein
MRQKALIVLLCFASTACGLQDIIKQESFKYSFSEGICETGEHSFSTNAGMCSGLQNNSLNNGCAQAQRQNYFYANCSGSFVPN